jgi:hypothetical protein
MLREGALPPLSTVNLVIFFFKFHQQTLYLNETNVDGMAIDYPVNYPVEINRTFVFRHFLETTSPPAMVILACSRHT